MPVKLLYRLYRCLFRGFSAIIRLYFYARCLYGKDKIESVRNHFGFATIKRLKGKLIWIHAASVGESTSALTFIHHVKKHFPDVNILITTITVTSAEILQPKIAEISNCYHQFAVVDNPKWVRRFLNYWKINAAFFIESEIWPNTIFEMHERRIPIFLLNARLSPKSFKRWNLLKGFFSDVLRKFTGILAQSKIDQERFSFFSPENTKRIDNLKYANAALPCDDTLFRTFQKICAGKFVFVAASTHEGEEDIILDAHEKLKKSFDIVTIIIPRHLTRIKRVCEIIKKHGHSFSLRSMVKNADSKKEIYCVDSFGEVGVFFRLADVCFVGGSIATIGGHNIYEPVALGKAVLHGPHMENALEVRDFLQKEKLAFEVKNSDEICAICKRLAPDLKNIAKRASSITKNDSLKQIDEIIQLSKILK